MSTTKLQDRPIVVGTPVEVEKAINDIRLKLATLSWITKPYFIAQRFTRKKGNRRFFFPETYAPDPDKESDLGYVRLTPDADQSGTFFFYVGRGSNDFNGAQTNFISYPVAIIFNVNLELIDRAKLKQGLFTGELMREARRLLTNSMIGFIFDYRITAETRDLRDCYREFVLDDIEQYNRAPMQCFRFDLDLRIEEDCI